MINLQSIMVHNLTYTDLSLPLCIYVFVIIYNSIKGKKQQHKNTCHTHTHTHTLTLGGGVVVGGPSDELLPPGAQGGEGGQQLVQLQALGAVVGQLLPDLVHLGGHRRRLAQALHRPLQGLQQGVHLVVELERERRETR